MLKSELGVAVSIPKLLTLLSVAETLAISPHTVRKMVRDGRLRPVHICRRLLFAPEEIERFLAAAKPSPSERLR